MNDDLQAKYVFLIEDDLSLNSSIKDILEFKQYHVKTYINATDFLEDFDSNIAPAVVVSDMRLPGLSGIDLQAKINDNFRKIPIIFISGESTLSQCISAMKMGALDFLLKPFEFNQLIDAIERGMDIDKLFMKSIIKRNELDINLQKLSPREQEVFHLLCRAYSNTEIMNELKISLPTTKQYKSQVMRKLNVQSVAELIKLKMGIM